MWENKASQGFYVDWQLDPSSVVESVPDDVLKAAAPPTLESILRQESWKFSRQFYQFLGDNPLRIHDLSPRRFEELVADILKDMGYQIELTPRTRDGGRDILAVLKTPLGELLTVVECKKRKPERPIGIDLVERFLYVVNDKDRASCGLLATTSFFSSGVYALARSIEYKLKLRDFAGIVEWVRTYGTWQRSGEQVIWTPAYMHESCGV